MALLAWGHDVFPPQNPRTGYLEYPFRKVGLQVSLVICAMERNPVLTTWDIRSRYS
jgi:hypothetical protein